MNPRTLIFYTLVFASLSSDSAPRDGKQPAYYNGQILTLNVKDLPGSKKANDKKVNFIYTSAATLPGSAAFTPVIARIPSDDFNAHALEIVISFSSGVTPRQFFSEAEIERAFNRGQITLQTTRNEVRAAVVGAKPKEGQLAILLQPEDQVLDCGGAAEFSVSVEAKKEVSYQWLFNDQIISGATSSTLSLSNLTGFDAGAYRVIVSNGRDQVVSEPAELIEPAPTPVVYHANNDPFLLVCWPPTCTKFQVERSFDGALWSSVTGLVGVVEGSNCMTLVTNAALYRLVPIPGLAPQLLATPADQSVSIGSTIMLAVEARGTPPLFYQWSLNGDDLIGETNPVLVLPAMTLANFGAYEVTVLNGCDSVKSPAAIISPSGLPGGLVDNFAGRITNVAPSGTIIGSNVGATEETTASCFEPNHAFRQGVNSVWMSWKSPGRGIATFHTRGSAFDTLLAAYNGVGNICTLDILNSDDDKGGFKTSEIRFSVLPDQVYDIAVDGLGGSQGVAVLSWSFVATDAVVPTIRTQPRTISVTNEGGGAGFSVDAILPKGFSDPDLGGDGGGAAVAQAFSYQWFRNNVPISPTDPNFTTPQSSSLGIRGVFDFLLGAYTVLVSNGSESVESIPVTLQIASDPTVLFANKPEEEERPLYDSIIFGSSQARLVSPGFIKGSSFLARNGLYQLPPCRTNGFVSLYVLNLVPGNTAPFFFNTSNTTNLNGNVKTILTTYFDLLQLPIACNPFTERVDPWNLLGFQTVFATRGYKEIVAIHTNTSPALITLTYSNLPPRTP